MGKDCYLWKKTVICGKRLLFVGKSVICGKDCYLWKKTVICGKRVLFVGKDCYLWKKTVICGNDAYTYNHGELVNFF